MERNTDRPGASPNYSSLSSFILSTRKLSHRLCNVALLYSLGWCVLRGVREALFIVLIGRFPGEIRAGTLITAL